MAGDCAREAKEGQGSAFGRLGSAAPDPGLALRHRQLRPKRGGGCRAAHHSAP